VISKSLTDLGITFEFFDAVDGRYGLDPVYENQIDREQALKARHRMSDVEFACALSHINVYHKITAENIPYALVLEDDAIPQPALANFLKGPYYQDADVTQLDIRRCPYVRWGGAKKLFDNYTSYLRAPRIEKAGAAGYVVSNKAAQHFIQNAVPVCREADWPDCAEEIIAERQWRIIHPLLVRHPRQYTGQSILDSHGRQGRKDRKFFDAFHRRKLRKTYGSLPRKVFYRRLPSTPPV